MVASVDLAASLEALKRTEPQAFANTTSARSTETPGVRVGAPVVASGPEFRPFVPGDPAYLTVEPDGRDDIGFLDRLRDAITRVASTFFSGDDLSRSVDSILSNIKPRLEDAAAAPPSGAQVRVASLDVAFTDNAAGNSVFASARQLAVEVSVARGDSVAADDVQVFTIEGQPTGLSAPEIRTGLTTGVYRRVETGGDSGLSEQARERLEAARAGLERVRAVQDALSAFRDGNEEPLRRLLEGDEQLAKVFPGTGPVALS